MMKQKRTSPRRVVRGAVSALLCILLGLYLSPEPAAAEGPGFLHLPVVEQDANTPTGLKTTWSCVYFGAYPSAEVVDGDWDAVDDYALRPGDVIRDDALFARLESADWQDDALELEGSAYVRVGLDRAPAAGGVREQHYRWDWSRPWHYFQVQPLRWWVLDIQENKALLLADRMPDCVPYNAADGERPFPIPDIANPAAVPDETAPGGTRTIWNAVAFGHYPQTEILDKMLEGLPAWARDGVEVNHELYRALEESAGDGEITVGDARYLRLEGRWFRCDPIIWRVLEVADGTALLLADRCLDAVPYHGEYEDVFWEESGLRSWLNHIFLESAFTEQERRGIAVSDVPNPNNHYFGTACGSGTRDKVFILSEGDNRGIPVTCGDAGIVPAIRVRLGEVPIARVGDITWH